MNISFAPRAHQHLQSIKAYISESDDFAAERVLSRILQSIMMFERFPFLGREGKVENTREFSIPNLLYIVIYTIASETDIDVLAIVHERRKYP